uniref:Uncharacterized protein n=1 Tax=Sphaerodactylus townsendi TaxID=933632 RepID=A0ACB8ENK4_9SAUR
MFFISLFARYSFRRTEPQLGTGPHISQTETAASSPCSPGENATLEQANGGFLCEEALCTIEHSPLDRFDFSTGEPVDKRQERGVRGQSRMGASRAKERHTGFSQQIAATEAPSIGPQGQIVTANADDVTVV